MVESGERSVELESQENSGAPALATSAVRNAKNIVLFSDGTGNSSAKLFKTNVWRAYEAVDLGPGPVGLPRQVAFYDDGVGTSTFRPLRMLQGVFGFGLKRNVLDIYCYACRNYDPNSVAHPDSKVAEPGDHIFGFGFSRGAFTMRLVIALIASQGLAPYTSERDLRQEAHAAWKRFRRGMPRVYERIAQLLGRTSKTPVDPDAGGKTRDGKPYHRPVIRFIGVWDTVAAYGGPVVEITRAIDNFIYRLSMPSYELHPRVRCARHALALDDERDSFQPLLWDELEEEGLHTKHPTKPWLKKGNDRLRQVWFAGVHADVGGGYPDESLSYVSLLWMLEEAHKNGLRTADKITDRYHALANSYAPIHDSRAGLAAYYRYQPRRIEAWLNPPDEAEPDPVLSLRDPAIRGADGKPKGLIRDVRVHISVIARIASGTDGYSPISLPRQFHVIPAGGLSESKLLETSGGDVQLSGADRRQAKVEPAPLVADQVRSWLQPPSNPDQIKAQVATAMERAWDLVWWRRANYFFTVFVTLAFLTIPLGWVDLLSRTDPARNLVGSLFRPSDHIPVLHPIKDALANLIRIPGEVVPGFMQGWTEGWARTPFWSIAILLLVIWSMRHGSALQRKISDCSRAVWHQAIPRIPPDTAGQGPVPFDDYAPTRLQKYRTSREYQRPVQFLKWVILPNLVFGPLMLLFLGWLLLVVATQVAAPFREDAIARCANDPPPRDSNRPEDESDLVASQIGLNSAQLCSHTGLRVHGGTVYRVSVDLNVDDPWRDGKYRADPSGLRARDMDYGVGLVGAPLRRVIEAGYLEVIAGIRVAPGEEQRGSVRFRRLRLRASAADPTRWEGEFEANATGNLYFFANDARLPWDDDYFYTGSRGRNRGSVCITIRREDRAVPLPESKEPICIAVAAQRASKGKAEVAPPAPAGPSG